MEEITEVAVKQDEFGFKKYGQYLDPMDDYDWLNMATEELADLMKYMKAEHKKRDIVLKEVDFKLDMILENLKNTGHTGSISLLKQIKSDIRRLSKNLDGKSGETTPDKQ